MFQINENYGGVIYSAQLQKKYRRLPKRIRMRKLFVWESAM